MKEQYYGIQILRFVAAIIVVITHSFFYANQRLGGEEIHWGNGSYGVDIFFVISGFVMVISSSHLISEPLGWAKFSIQRLIRITPMYWLATTIKLFVMLLSMDLVLNSGNFSVSDIVNSYLFIPYEKAGKIEPLLGVGWTLVFEMFFYLIFAFSLLVRANIYLFTGIIMISLSLLSLFRPESHPVYMFLFDSIVLEFWMGMLIGYLTIKNKLINKYIGLFFATSSLLFIILYSGKSYGIPRVVLHGIPAAILVYSTISIEALLKKTPKLLLYLGAASYSLYLFHSITLPAIPVVLKKFGLINTYASVSISIFASLPMALLIYYYIENPTTKILRKIPAISRLTHKPVTESI